MQFSTAKRDLLTISLLILCWINYVINGSSELELINDFDPFNTFPIKSTSLPPTQLY